MRGRFCPGDSFDSNRTVIEVDVAAGLILIGVFHGSLGPAITTSSNPQMFSILSANCPIRISKPLVSLTRLRYRYRLFGRRTGDEQRRIKASARYFFIIPGACCVCFYASCRRRAPALFLFLSSAYSPRYAPFTLEQEVDHLLLQQLAVLGIHHVEFLFINQHGLFVLPLRPGFFGDFVIDAFRQLAGVS